MDRSRVPRNAGLNARNGTLTAPEFGGLHSQGSAASVESSILGYSGDTPTNIFRRYPSGAASTPKTDYLSIINLALSISLLVKVVVGLHVRSCLRGGAHVPQPHYSY